MNINISKLNNIYKLDKSYLRLSDEWKDKDITMFEFFTDYERNIVRPKNLILKPSITIEFEGKFIASINLNRTDKNTRRMSSIKIASVEADSFYDLIKKLSGLDLENSYSNIDKLFTSQKETYIIISKGQELNFALFSGKDTIIKKWNEIEETSFVNFLEEIDTQLCNKIQNELA